MKQQVTVVKDFESRLPDEICIWKSTYDSEELVWWFSYPGIGVGCLARHKVVEHEDETITASPSIKLEGNLGVAHGYIERNIWRDC